MSRHLRGADPEVARPSEVKGSRRSLWVLAALVFLVVLVANLMSPNIVSADSLRSVFVSLAIYKNGDLNIQPYSPPWTMGAGLYGIVPTDHSWLPLFPWGPSLFAVPLVAAADLYLRVSGRGTIEQHLSQPHSTWIFELVSMSTVVALTAVVVFFMARERLTGLTEGRRRVASLLVALVFAFGTSAWSTSSRPLWQHGPAMLFCCLALLAAARLANRETPGRLLPLALGASAATAFVMRPTTALIIMALGVWLLVWHRRSVGWAVLGGLPVAAVFVAVSMANYGSLLPGYYQPTSVDTSRIPDPVQAFFGNLVSPARGLLVFSPFLVIALYAFWQWYRRRHVDSLELVCAGLVVAHLLVVSRFPHWWGGYSYGPRFMSETVPPLVLLCLPAVARLATVRRVGTRVSGVLAARVLVGVLVAASVFAHGQGALFRSSWCWNAMPSVDEHPERLWDWDDAQVTAGIRGVMVNGWDAETSRAGAVIMGCDGLVG